VPMGSARSGAIWGLDFRQMAERRKPKTALLNSTGRSTHGR
jgi:hypothetical protein